MPSPFPGMNPYLEQEEVWQDFHDAMIPALRDALSPQVSPHFIVKIEEHLYIHEPVARLRIRIGSGDLDVIRPMRIDEIPGSEATMLKAPAQILLPQVEMVTETYLEVRDRKSRELVTVIELLSPTNKKPGPDREQYLIKRANVLRGTANFVEIDLLRGWAKMPSRKAPRSAYSVMISCPADRPRAAYWPIVLRDPLPVIPIPLRQPLDKAYLDLQATLHLVYDRAYYKDYIYDGVPIPPLRPVDRKWAKGFIAR